MERAITALMIWSGMPVASSGQGRQRLPAGYRAHAQSGILVVHDPGEVPAQFDHGGQFAALEIGLADGCSGRFVNGEHGVEMGGRPQWASNAATALPP